MSVAASPTSALDFARLFDLLPNPYMLVDRELRYVAANQAYLRVTGARFEDLVGRSLFDVFPNDPGDPRNESARTLRASFARVLASGETDFLAFIPYRVSTDEVRYWSATHVPVLDDAGEVRFILQQTSDVTEMVASEAPQIGAAVLQRAQRVQETNAFLDASLRRMRELFEQAPGFVCALRGPRHVFEFANDAYLDLVGRRDILGLPLVTALPEIASQGFDTLLDEVRATGRPYVAQAAEVQLQRVPGAALETRWLTFIYQPIVEDGEVTGIFVQGHDVTEQKLREAERDALYDRERAARAEAEEASRLKDEFLATVSHELRTPLTAILGWAQMLRDGRTVQDPDRRERALSTIERNARAQAQLIDDLLDVSRILSGRLKIEVEPVRLSDVVSAAMESVRPAADARGVRVESALDATARVVGDPARLQQVVWNLLSNAVKFTPRGGSVRARVAREAGAVTVEVSDTGQGISREFLPHVFERFRQGEGEGARKHGGLGLGLAIVKHLVESHGGAVTARSEGEGRGASFTVALPEAAPRAGSDPGDALLEAGSIPSEGALSGVRVLAVDDEPDARELVSALLEHCGAEVEVASSASEALASVLRAPPDVIVSDIGMPGEDGYAFMLRLRALPAGSGGATPAVALTAFARSEDRARALRAGFDAHVPKPIEPAELVAVLTSLVRLGGG